MSTDIRVHTPGARDRALALVRRLTYGSAGAAAIGVAVLAAVAGFTYPGVSSTASASNAGAATSSPASTDGTSSSTIVTQTAAVSAVQNSTTTTHAVSGASR